MLLSCIRILRICVRFLSSTLFDDCSYRRDWRFHKHEQVWIAKSGSNFERLPNQNGERGQYTVFHPGKWERTTQNFTLYYDSLDNAPPKFPNFNPYNVSALNNTAGASAAPAAASTGNAGHH